MAPQPSSPSRTHSRRCLSLRVTKASTIRSPSLGTAFYQVNVGAHSNIRSACARSVFGATGSALEEMDNVTTIRGGSKPSLLTFRSTLRAFSFLILLVKTRRMTRRRHRGCTRRHTRRGAPVEDSALRVRDEGKDGLWWTAHRFNELWHEEDIVVPCVRLLPS